MFWVFLRKQVRARRDFFRYQKFTRLLVVDMASDASTAFPCVNTCPSLSSVAVFNRLHNFGRTSLKFVSSFYKLHTLVRNIVRRVKVSDDRTMKVLT